MKLYKSLANSNIFDEKSEEIFFYAGFSGGGRNPTGLPRQNVGAIHDI